MQLPVFLELRQQPAGGQRRLGTDPQAAGSTAGDALGGSFKLVQQGADFFHIAPAFLGQQQALADLLHQRAAEHLFEVLDLPAHGALGQAEFFGGTGDAHVPGEGGEAGQGDHAGESAHGSSLHIGMSAGTINRYRTANKRF
ncbi:hypothetical protein D3C72_1773870 [compost metagenome]